MKWFGNRCQRRQDVSLLVAGVLNEEEKIELENHLGACQDCRNYLAEIKTLIVPFAGWKEKLSPIEATPAARMRWANAIQEAALASSISNPNPPRERLRLGIGLWRSVWVELIWPSRRAWAGMAALWLVMLVVNGRLSDHRIIEASAHSPSTLDVMQAWEEQNRVLAELTQPGFSFPTPPPILPQPRSERKQDWEII